VDLITQLGESIITGVSAAILYKGIVNVFKTSLNYEDEIKNKLSKDQIFELLKVQQQSIKTFNKSGAVFLTIIFYIMIQKFKQNQPININFNLNQSNTNLGGDGIVTNTSLLPIFTLKNKKTPK
jgi:hypothetical protein